jgi:hypothetical protein
MLQLLSFSWKQAPTWNTPILCVNVAHATVCSRGSLCPCAFVLLLSRSCSFSLRTVNGTHIIFLKFHSFSTAFLCVSQDGDTALINASINGHAAIVKLLIEAGAKKYTANKVSKAHRHASTSLQE